MQQITFKVGDILVAYDKIITEYKKEYIKEVGKFITKLINYVPYVSYYDRFINWLWKIEPKQKDISWIRQIETELKNYNYITPNDKYFSIHGHNFSYYQYFFCDNDRFAYYLDDITILFNKIAKYEKEIKTIKNSNSSFIIIDQDEAEKLNLNK